MGQALQLPQPQTMDLPCFFFLTIFTMIAATIAMSTAQMMIVHIFCDNHVIVSTPLSVVSIVGEGLVPRRRRLPPCPSDIPPTGCLPCSRLLSQLGSLFVGLEEHIHHARDQQDRDDQTEHVQSAREGRAYLEDAQRYGIREAALICYSERCPLA